MNGNRRRRSSSGAKNRQQNLLWQKMPSFFRFCCSLRSAMFVLLAFSSVISLLLIGFLVFSDPAGIFQHPSSPFKLANNAQEQQFVPSFIGQLESQMSEKLHPNTKNISTASLYSAIQNDSGVPLSQQIPVLVFCAKRPLAIENHLKQLLRLRPSADHFPIIVSQDGDDANVANKIQEFVGHNPRLYHIKHSIIEPTKKPSKSIANYYLIAQHYKWALDKVFIELGFSVAIITEEDLDIASDFFSYFNATRPLLYSDPTIWCISAWNDNGNPALVDWEGGVTKLWRTDFFPGLGWMLRAELWGPQFFTFTELWNELRRNWPEAFWDDWLRRQDIREDRVCIRPELSRTLHNATVAGRGSSKLPENTSTQFLGQVDSLKKENFDHWLATELKAAKQISLQQILEATPNKSSENEQNGTAFIVRYKNPKEFRQLSSKFGLMADIRAGMTRTAYFGVVPFFVGGIQFYAVHNSLEDFNKLETMNSSQIYDQEWDKMSKYLDFAELYCTPKRYTGKCDPNDEKMRQWFRSKGWAKRLEQWGEMTVLL